MRAVKGSLGHSPKREVWRIRMYSFNGRSGSHPNDPSNGIEKEAYARSEG